MSRIRYVSLTIFYDRQRFRKRLHAILVIINPWDKNYHFSVILKKQDEAVINEVWPRKKMGILRFVLETLFKCKKTSKSINISPCAAVNCLLLLKFFSLVVIVTVY